MRYLAFLRLVAHEPELEWKSQVQKFLAQQSRSQAIGMSQFDSGTFKDNNGSTHA
jgi:hypothetical protein